MPQPAPRESDGSLAQQPAPDAARTAALDSLTASGWQVLPALFHASRTFEASSTEISAACREGKAFTVTAAEMEGITYTQLSLSA
ncbi:MAG: hypothetical protein WDO12_10285 [Pseudomonadota bacterium]